LRQGGSGVDVWRAPLLMRDGQPRREVPIVDLADRAGAPLARALASRAAGSIGMALLDGCRFTLDLVDRRLLVHACVAQALRGGFGLQWVLRGSVLVLARVWPGSPAAQAGLRPGDRVLSINGAGAPDGLPAADALLYAAETVDLIVERGDGRGDERGADRATERVGAKLARSYFLPAR
jgi:membrane-associated protease RseP (regulator of RpoE activity)